ncbi:MAG: ABC transporter permease [Anaerolineaceae bacterium]|jgi:peptide/nickel transport system permease protein
MAANNIPGEDILLDRVKVETQTTIIWQNFKRHKIAVLASIVFILIALACFAAPLIAPYKFDAIDLSAIREPPAIAHLMGTDDLGRDLFTRILYGGRISILIGIFSAVIGTGLGTLVGAIAGFYGGPVDNILMRFTDIAYSIPTLPLLIVLSSFSSSAVPTIILIIGFLSWMPTARVVRGSVLSAKEKEYIEAARMIGAPDGVIIWQHILPNVAGPIIVGATLGVGYAIITESSLSFLGLGVQPPTPTWGNMLMDSQATMAQKPWLTIFPGMAILIIVLAVNFIGDGLHDALDPTLRRR